MTLTPWPVLKARKKAQLRKRSLWRRFVDFLSRIRNIFRGELLEERLRQEHSVERTDAQKAVDKVVYETSLPPDCVTAFVRDGGCAIQVVHFNAKEVFVHRTFAQAAVEAVRWAEANEKRIDAGSVSLMNRKQRRAFNARRKKMQARH